MKKKELQKAYEQYITEIAKDAITRKEVNPQLVNIVSEIQTSIRDIDIMNAMNQLSQVPNIPTYSDQEKGNATINEFGEIIREEPSRKSL